MKDGGRVHSDMPGLLKGGSQTPFLVLLKAGALIDTPSLAFEGKALWMPSTWAWPLLSRLWTRAHGPTKTLGDNSLMADLPHIFKGSWLRGVNGYCLEL